MSNPSHTGQCLCGQVHYTINADPMMAGHCNCVDCQRATGAAHMTAAFFPRDAFEIAGDMASHTVTADSGNTVERFFCPTCGGRLFAENSGNPEMRAVMVGSLDNKEAVSPQMRVYQRNRPSWDLLDETLPGFETMPG